MDLAVTHHQPDPACIRDAHAHTRVLHGAGDAHVPGLVVIGLHRLQRLHQAGGIVHDLSIGQLLTGADGVAVADLPGADAHQVRHLVQQALDAEAGLCHAEAPEGAGGWIVRVIGPAIDLKILVVIGAGGVGAGALQHRTAQGGVGSGVGDDLGGHALDDAVFVTAQGEFHLHGVALGVDQNALRPAQLDLHRALRQIGDQGGVVLDRHILLAAEAAAHQAVADLYPLGGQAQHAHGLVLGVIGALVRGEDHHAIPVGIGHGALRLQESVFRPGGGETLCQHIFGLGDSLRRIAPLDVLVGQQVALPVDQRRVGQHGLPGAADRLQRLIVHLHQRLGLGQDLRCLGGYQADGVAQVVGDIPLGDHGVPVLFQVAHLVAAGNVGGGEYPHHAGKRLGLLGVDGQHSGPRIFAADGGAIDHAVQIDVIGIDAGAGDLFPYVHPGHPRAQRPVPGDLRHLSLAEQLRRQQDTVDDLHIAGAAADIVADGKGRLLPAGGGIHVQQALSAHDHARDAEAALHRPGHAEGVCIDVPLKVRQALHSDDVLALQLIRLGNAGLCGLAVDQDGAGAAGTLAAAVFHAGQV